MNCKVFFFGWWKQLFQPWGSSEHWSLCSCQVALTSALGNVLTYLYRSALSRRLPGNPLCVSQVLALRSPLPSGTPFCKPYLSWPPSGVSPVPSSPCCTLESHSRPCTGAITGLTSFVSPSYDRHPVLLDVQGLENVVSYFFYGFTFV